MKTYTSCPFSSLKTTGCVFLQWTTRPFKKNDKDWLYIRFRIFWSVARSYAKGVTSK